MRKGQRVVRGQKLAKIGDSGFSTGPHLHFELRTSRGAAINSNKNAISYEYDRDRELPGAVRR